MCSVISATEISFASVENPRATSRGSLLSLEGRFAEISLDSETHLTPGTLVRIQSSETLYLAEIESSTSSGIRVLIEHSVNLERAGAIRRLWNTDNSL